MAEMIKTDVTEKIPSDSDIIELYWKRDEEAIKMTDRKYGAFLFRIAYNILHDKLDSEECRNDTYLGTWNAIPPARPMVFSTFISKIARNLAMHKYKERTRQKRIPSELTMCIDDLGDFLQSEGTPENEISSAELGQAINDFLASIPTRRQYIFVARFYMGDKLERIAEELNINISTVHREIEKIKKGLKSYLERRDIYV